MVPVTSVSLCLSLVCMISNYVLVGGVPGRTGASGAIDGVGGVCYGTPCQNGGTCSADRGGSFRCACPGSYTGESCQTYINPCSSSPCLNGGSCVPPEPSGDWYCECPPGLTGRTCEISLVCRSNPCSNGGTCVANGTNRTCLCYPFTTGTNCDLTTEPFTEMTPTFGPNAGGTEIIITSSVPIFHLTEIVTVHFEYRGYSILTTASILSNRTILVVTGPVTQFLQPVPDQEYTVDIQTIKLKPLKHLPQLADLYKLPTNFTFTYKNDPVILSIFPLESIRAGGTDLTVHGRYLKSVSQIVMLITRVDRANIYQHRTTVFESNCTVLSEITMKCPTPNMTLPDHNATLNNPMPARRKRAAPTGTCDYEWSNTTDFYIGFRLDGLTRYRTLTNELPEFSKLRVTANPSFERFAGEPATKSFKPYENNFLQIKGDQLDCAAPHLYKVFIGDTDCPLTEIFLNSLTCRPPNETPEDTRIGKTIDGSPRVEVRIDHLRFDIGHLKYDRSIWDDDINKYIILGVVGGVIIIVLLVLCIYCTCRRKNKDKEKIATPAYTAA